jgi:hypothetical protein
MKGIRPVNSYNLGPNGDIIIIDLDRKTRSGDNQMYSSVFLILKESQMEEYLEIVEVDPKTEIIINNDRSSIILDLVNVEKLLCFDYTTEKFSVKSKTISIFLFYGTNI